MANTFDVYDLDTTSIVDFVLVESNNPLYEQSEDVRVAIKMQYLLALHETESDLERF